MKAYTKACEYTYNIHWSHDLGGYVATVAEFPTLTSPVAPTPCSAITALTATVEGALRELDRNGEAMPISLALS